MVDTDLAGGIAVVRDGAGLTRSAAGYSDVETREGFAAQTHIRAASITKTFVAATVLQLVAEGKIDLDAPSRRICPAASAARTSTPRRSRCVNCCGIDGLPEYFDDDTPPPTEPVSADELLDAALTRPAQFAPGTAMKYTNTNYIIAGLLIEKVTGRPAADEITWRIIVPLGLSRHTSPRRVTWDCVAVRARL